MILPIYVYGSEVLREQAAKLDYKDEKLQAELKELIHNMFETMENSDGVGLAAPQIGKSIQLLVIDGSPLQEDMPDLKGFRFAMINPEVVEESNETAEYIRANSDMKIRLNTNGLVRLIHPGFDVERFRGLIDIASISLNAPDAKRYNEVTRPHFGEPAFQAMLDFARDMKNMGVQTKFTAWTFLWRHKDDDSSQSIQMPLAVAASRRLGDG